MSVSVRQAHTLRFDGLVLRSTARQESDLLWLEEFLTPWFEVAAPADADCQVELREDDLEYRQRRAAGPREDGATTHCFWLDRGAVRLPLWRAQGEERVAFDERMRVFYIVGPDPTRIEILTPSGNQKARFALMRVLRELALLHTRAHGRLVVHAAAVAIDAGTLLIAGPKGVGKTSLLMAFLLQHRAGFVSNDRVVVGLDPSGAIVRGMPTVVSVRSQTLDAHPELRTRLERSGYDHRLRIAELQGDRRQRTASGSVDLSPAQLCALLRAEPRAGGRLAAVLFPSPGAIDGNAMLVRLDAADAGVKLTDALMAADANQVMPESLFASVLARGRMTDRTCADERERIAEAAGVPSFALRPDAGGYDGRRAVAELVRHLRTAGIVPEG